MDEVLKNILLKNLLNLVEDIMDTYYDGVKFAGLNNILKGIVPTITNDTVAPIEYAYLYDTSLASFTDYTTAANNATANDVNLQGPSNNVTDIFFFGSAEWFPSITVNVGTAGIGGTVGQFFYWNGTAWTALASVVDGTTNFTVAGTNTITYTLPTDWATTTVNGTSAYWIEFVHAAGDYTTVPLATQIWLSGKPVANLANATDNNTATVTDILSGTTSGSASIGEWNFDMGTSKIVLVGAKVGIWSSASNMAMSIETSSNGTTFGGITGARSTITQTAETAIIDIASTLIINRYFRLRCVIGAAGTGYARLYEVYAYQLG